MSEQLLKIEGDINLGERRLHWQSETRLVIQSTSANPRSYDKGCVCLYKVLQPGAAALIE